MSCNCRGAETGDRARWALRSVIQLGTGITGKSEGSVPGQELEEQDLADVIAHLRATFGG